MIFGRRLRDYLIGLMALLFGFSAAIGLFFNKSYLYKVGSRKITQKDILNVGGFKGEESFRMAMLLLYQRALIGSECDKLGIKVADSDLKNELKNFMFRNRVVDDKSFEKVSGGYTKEGLIELFRSRLEREQLFYIPKSFALVKPSFVKDILKTKKRKFSGYFKLFNFSSDSKKEAQSSISSLKNKFNIFGSYYPDRFFAANGFSRFKEISIDSCFKDSGCSECTPEGKCAKCMANCCLCPKCFDEKNKDEIERESALAILSSTEIKKLTTFEGDDKFILMFIDKIEEVDPSDIEVERLQLYYNSFLDFSMEMAYVGDLSVQNRVS